MNLIPVKDVPTQRIELGGKTYEAAAVILIRNREDVMTAMSKGQTVKPRLQFITFQKPTDAERLLSAKDAGMDLLAIVMADGTAKYLVQEPHVRFAEQIVFAMEDDVIAHLPRPKGLN